MCVWLDWDRIILPTAVIQLLHKIYMRWHVTFFSCQLCERLLFPGIMCQVTHDARKASDCVEYIWIYSLWWIKQKKKKKLISVYSWNVYPNIDFSISYVWFTMIVSIFTRRHFLSIFFLAELNFHRFSFYLFGSTSLLLSLSRVRWLSKWHSNQILTRTPWSILPFAWGHCSSHN